MSILSKSITKRSDDWSARSEPGVLEWASQAWKNPAQLFRKLITEPTNSGAVQFFRYGFVGGIAFLCDFASLWLATSLLGLHYLVSAVLGFCIGLFVNYWLSVRWVFTTRKFTRASVQFGLFALVGVVGVGVNEFVMWWLTDGAGVHYLASKLVATVLVYLWNFSIRKALIF